MVDSAATVTRWRRQPNPKAGRIRRPETLCVVECLPAHAPVDVTEPDIISHERGQPVTGNAITDLDLEALAGALIRQAVVDAAWRPTRTPQSKNALKFHAECRMARATALAFLNSRALDWWCHVGGFDAHRVRHAILTAMRDGLHHQALGHRYTPRKRAA